MTSLSAITGNPMNGDTVTIKAGSAAYNAIASATTKTLYSDGDNQEIGRFAIKASDVENVTLKELNFTVAATSAELLSSYVNNVRLFNLDTNTEISANVTVDDVAKTIRFSNVSYALTKGTKYNFKVVADFGDVADYTATPDTIKLAFAATHGAVVRNSSTDSDVTGTAPTFDPYTFGTRPLQVSIAALAGSDPKFAITIKNSDSQTGVLLSGLTIRTQVTAGADYTGSICLLPTQYANDADCTNGITGTVVSVPGTSEFAITVANFPDALLDKNGGEITLNALVDSSFIAQKVVATVTKVNNDTVSASATYNSN